MSDAASIFHGAEVGAERLHPKDIFNPFGEAGGWQAFIKRGTLGAPDFYYGWGQGLTEAEAVAAAAANYKQDVGRPVPPHGSGP